jgi:predicted esterase
MNLNLKTIALICLISTNLFSQSTETRLLSNVFVDSIYSESLSEYRKHNVYLPPNYSKDKLYPAVFATDGVILNEYSLPFYSRLDSIILNGYCKPFILVESYSNSKLINQSGVTKGDNQEIKIEYRNIEYANLIVSNMDEDLKNRFENHYSYFTKEFITAIENQYAIDTLNESFYGVSNGAGFGMYLFNRQPFLLNSYLCFSTYGGNIQNSEWNKKITYPNLFYVFGDREPPFIQQDADYLKKKLKKVKSPIFVEKYLGGHDYKIWEIKFLELIPELINRNYSQHAVSNMAQD